MIKLNAMTLLLLTLFISNVAFAAKTPIKKSAKEGMSLSAGIDFEPKKITLQVKYKPTKDGENVVVQKVVVYNKTKEAILVRPVLYEYNPDEFGLNDHRKSVANIKVPELSLNDYISYSKDVISLEPNGYKEISFQIRFKGDMVGSKFSLFTFERVQEYVTKSSSIDKKSSFSFELKILGLMSVDVINSGTVGVKQVLQGTAKNSLVIDVNNTGNHQLANSQLEGVLMNSDMKVIEKFQMSPVSKVGLIPGKKKRFVHYLAKKYPKGKYKLYTHYKANNGNFFDSANFDVEL